MVSIPSLACLFLGFLGLGYGIYSKIVERHLSLDPGRPTPAQQVNDGVDFVPTHPFYLFAQHFSAIAAAGPIAGPIVACQIFGWLPCLIWIGLGVILIGAVHDFTTLAASVRHGGWSIAEVAKKNLGPHAGLAMLIFIWLAIVYIIVAFTDITASSFVTATEELQAASVSFNPGGAVAAASTMYLLLAVVLGGVQRVLRPPLWIMTLLFVPLTFAMAWFGTHVSHVLLLDTQTWQKLILGYCAIASLLPMWLLLQPRGYLGGFILFFAIAVGIIGVFFGGYEIQQPFFKTWDSGTLTGSLFPFLFVTIACGACSGFHGLVCCGTTSKQVAKESHVRPVGYGAMLAEGFVAFIALVIVMIASNETLQGVKPGTIYGNGIGQFLTLIIGKENLPFAITFGAMAFSTFVFDTLDVATRLGRYILQELTGQKNRWGALAATLATVGIPALILGTTEPGGWLKFWTVFGASNQLLAGLTLLLITVWLQKSRKPFVFTLLPMIFVLTITLWALIKLALGSLVSAQSSDWINSTAAIVLVLLALYLVGQSLRQYVQKQDIQGLRQR